MSATRLTAPSLRRDDWKEVQQALREMGYYTGNIDGQPNPRSGQSQTMQAITRMAQERNIPIASLYDPATGVVSADFTFIVQDQRMARVQPPVVAPTPLATPAAAPVAGPAPVFNEALFRRNNVAVPRAEDARALSFMAGVGQTANRDQVMQAQRIFKADGADLGRFGANRDGIDGDFGGLSQRAAGAYLGRGIERLRGLNTEQLQRVGLTASQRDQYVTFLDGYVRNDVSNNNKKLCVGSLGAFTRLSQIEQELGRAPAPSAPAVATPQTGEWVPLIERQGNPGEEDALFRRIYTVQVRDGSQQPIMRNTVTGALRLPDGMVRAEPGVNNTVAQANERTLIRAVADHGIRLGIEPSQSAPIFMYNRVPQAEGAALPDFALDPRTGRSYLTAPGYQGSRALDAATRPEVAPDGMAAGRSTLDRNAREFETVGAVFPVRAILNGITADGIITPAELTARLPDSLRGVVGQTTVSGGQSVSLATPVTALQVGIALRGASPHIQNGGDGSAGGPSGGSSAGGPGSGSGCGCGI